MKGKESKKEKKKEKSETPNNKVKSDYQKEKTSKHDKSLNPLTKT